MKFLFFLCTVTFVIHIYVKIVSGNISQMVCKNIGQCHLGCADHTANVRFIQQKYLNGTVKNVTYRFVLNVSLLKSTKDMKLLILWKKLESKKDALQRDLQKLEQSIYPSYNGIAMNILVQKTQLKENTDKSLIAINTHEEDLHREVDSHYMTVKSDLNEIKSKQTAILIKEEDEIRHIISEITQSIAALKKLMGSNNICLISDYMSRNEEL